jgi:hypothetical protein
MADATQTGRDQRFLDPKTLTKISRLDIIARVVVEGFVTGLHRSPYHGFSVEFAEHREYVPGDDIKHIDWKVYARSDRYYIKQYEEETNLRNYVVLDTSPSMRYKGDADLSKLEYGSFLAAGLQVPDATNPSPTTRRVTLADDTIRTLNAHLDGRSTDASALFLGADGRITVPEVRRLVRDAAEAADVAPHHADGSRGTPADVTPETIRHSTAWRMLNAERGASLYDVQSRMRHASLDATKRVYGDFADA